MFSTRNLDVLLRLFDASVRSAARIPPLTPLGTEQSTRTIVKASGQSAAPTGNRVATVLERYAVGDYRLSVAGQAMRLALPSLPDLGVGDRVVLEYESEQAAAAQNGAGTVAASSTATPAVQQTLRANTALPVAPQTELEGSAPSATTRLSPAAQWVARALADTPLESSAVIRAAAPLLTTPPHASVELARALNEAIVQSGLFYESHIATWAVQHYPLHRLVREPQAVEALQVVAREAASAGAAPSAPLATGSETVDAEPLPPIMRDQLQVLETRTLVWQGELWPGQRGRIEIAEEEAHVATDDRGENEAASASGWRTRIKLRLPALGEIEATLALAQDHLRVHLAAPEAATRDALAAGAAEFADILRERALTLDDWIVEDGTGRA